MVNPTTGFQDNWTAQDISSGISTIMIQNTLRKLQKQEMFRIRKGRSNDYDSFHFEAKHEGSIG